MGKGKIIYAASTFSHLEKFHQAYIEALRRDGHEVVTLATGVGADIDLRLEKKMFSLSNIVRLPRLALIIRRERPDLVILNTALASVAVRMVLPLISRPRVVNISHGYLFSEKSGGLRSFFLLLCERLLASRTDALLVMNREDLRLAVRYKLYSKRVYFINGMGVKLSEPCTCRDDARRELMLEEKFVLTYVGELSERKNQEFLVRALPMLIHKMPNAVLMLVGDGGEKNNLARLAESLGVSHAVRLLGYRTDVMRLLSATDLYVSASLSEGLPFNIIEALSQGLTVLISNIKGHNDIVDDGVDGFLFKTNNTHDFVNKTCQIYNKIIKINPGKSIKKSVQFSFSKAYPKTLSIIRKEIRHAKH